MRATQILGVLALCAIVALALTAPAPQAPVQAASVIFSECADARDKSACYETKVPALYGGYSVQELFEVVRALRIQDPSYQFCHVLAHKIGERVVAEDPVQWVDAMVLNPSDGLCSNGYIHGVVGGRFRAEVLDATAIDSLVPDFARACEARQNWSPSDLDRAICYHGMGHLYDFITDADIPAALDLCARTTPAAYRRVCVEGVFMQLYQPLEPDDFALIARLPVTLTQESVGPFCATFKDEYFVGACLRESWPLWEEVVRTGVGVVDFCSNQPNMEQEGYCYDSISALVGRKSLTDPAQALRACANFPDARQSACISASAQAILEEQRTDISNAIAFCTRAPTPHNKECYGHLASRAKFIFGADRLSLTHFCSMLPPSYQEQCTRS